MVLKKKNRKGKTNIFLKQKLRIEMEWLILILPLLYFMIILVFMVFVPMYQTKTVFIIYFIYIVMANSLRVEKYINMYCFIFYWIYCNVLVF